jgi:6-pyruvoyltetrahydropterin/6-carboxytetrahydropterin synthase
MGGSVSETYHDKALRLKRMRRHASPWEAAKIDWLLSQLVSETDQPISLARERQLISITKRVNFEAAHRLESWTWSKCHNVHGHSWALEVTLQCSVLQMQHCAVQDLTQIGDILKKVVFDRLDHQYINEVLDETNPTCEIIALWAWKELKPVLPFLSRVRIYETETGWADYDGTA